MLLDSQLFRKILFGATIIATIIYAWVASRVLEPRIELSTHIIHDAAWVENGVVSSLEEVQGLRAMEISKISAEIRLLAASFGVIGYLREPIDILINADASKRLLVTESRIEIGTEIAALKGQLKKAILKAWLLQHANEAVSASYLRLEIVSDLLLAMLEGELRLQAFSAKGDRPQKLNFVEPGNWLRFVSSYEFACLSEWRGIELGALCSTQGLDAVGRSELISPLGFRQLLGSLLWTSYINQPLSDRVTFVRRWANSLKRDFVEPEGSLDREGDELTYWRDRVREEVKILMPTSLLPEAKDSLHGSLSAARLLESQKLMVEFVLKSHQSEASSVDVARLSMEIPRHLLGGSVALVETPGGLYTLPGLARVALNERSAVSSRHLIWESCGAPEVGQVVDYPLLAKRTLYVKNCETPFSAAYSPLFVGGLRAFAISNPATSFIQMRGEAMRLALKRNILRSDSSLAMLMVSPKSQKVSSELGLQNSLWSREVAAYRVLGAVEAVEWFRSFESLAETDLKGRKGAKVSGERKAGLSGSVTGTVSGMTQPPKD